MREVQLINHNLQSFHSIIKPLMLNQRGVRSVHFQVESKR